MGSSWRRILAKGHLSFISGSQSLSNKSPTVCRAHLHDPSLFWLRRYVEEVFCHENQKEGGWRIGALHSGCSGLGSSYTRNELSSRNPAACDFGQLQLGAGAPVSIQLLVLQMLHLTWQSRSFLELGVLQLPQICDIKRSVFGTPGPGSAQRLCHQ
jgi:hypothetical protein